MSKGEFQPIEEARAGEQNGREWIEEAHDRAGGQGEEGGTGLSSTYWGKEVSLSIRGDCIESWVVAGVLFIILPYYRILYVVLVISLL